MRIFLISGRARNGKDTTGNFLVDYFNKKNEKSVKTQYSKYIKMYTKDLTDWDGAEESKSLYRDFMIEIGTAVIREKMNQEDFFVNRMIQDIEVYANYVNNVIVTDVRLPIEIDNIKSHFNNVYSIRVIREDYETELTKSQQNHRTETTLSDNEEYYDYLLKASTLEELENEVLKMIKEIEHNEEINK